MNYCEIKTADIANGIGVRVSLFVAGCTHHCKGCFNAETWNFAAGKPFTDAEISLIVHRLKSPFLSGLSLLGGEPFEPCNQRGILPLIRRVQAECPDKSIWAYSGYVYDRDLVAGGRAHCEVTDEILDALEVLVDGPFIEEKKDISLRFRGSSNQRLIDMKPTRQTGEIHLCDEKRFTN